MTLSKICTMQEQIEKYVADKRFKEAFRLMQENKYEYIDALEADYNNELRVNIFGLYTEDDWLKYEQKLQQRLRKILDGGVSQTDGGASRSFKKGPTVFISYSGIDRSVADAIYKYLKSKNISVKIDSIDKSLTEDVSSFILEQFRLSDYVILLISPNSLASGWVGVEHELALFSDQLSVAKYLVITSDEGRFNNDNNYYLEVHGLIDQKIREIESFIKKAKGTGYTNPYHAQLERFSKRKNSLGEVFSRLKARGTAADISGDLFETGMQRICEQILADFGKRKGRG